MRLADKTAIVTGGSSSIGRETAIEFAEAGADVAICDVREQPLNEGARPTAEAVRDRGRRALFGQVDVSDYDGVSAFVEEVAEEFGGVDILMNNAGHFPPESRGKSIDELSPDEWATLIDINLSGAYNCSHAALPYVRESDAGRVINVASKMGLVGHKQAPGYSAAKGGIVTLTKQMAIDYASDAVTVNAICPGIVETGTKQYRLEQKGERMRRNTPLPYFGESRDIARSALFLASEDGRFITGHALVVDGGWTAQ